MKKTIYPISTLMKIWGFEIKDLPVSKPTYYSMVYNDRKHHDTTYKRLATFLGIKTPDLRESLELEKVRLEEKKQ